MLIINQFGCSLVYGLGKKKKSFSLIGTEYYYSLANCLKRKHDNVGRGLDSGSEDLGPTSDFCYRCISEYKAQRG